MDNQKTAITLEQMKALARYEITFEQFMADEDLRDDEFSFEENYRMTLEDLHAAFTNILAKNPTLGDMDRFWYSPLRANWESFGLPVTCDEEDYDDELILDKAEPAAAVDTALENDGVSGDLPDGYVRYLPITEEDVFLDIWDALNDLWYDEDDDSFAADIKQIPGFLKEIELFWANKDKPLLEREFSDRQKQWFISDFDEDDEWIEEASDLELQLCRKFTEELCDKGDVTALHLKGYACYGGNRLYDCDWKASRDCMIRLYDLTDDARYANTLGYIYYYGRCTDGVPEYEKAFQMFSIAAANWYYEGMYKLADMYRHGYACKKSPRTAKCLYMMAYEDCYRRFLKGEEEGPFADAALRMGNVWMKGIDEEVDPEAAYRFYLQADLASRMRIKASDFFGNTTVAINIRKALDEAKAALPEDYSKEYVSVYIPSIFYNLVEDGYRAELSLQVTESGETVVTANRLPRPYQETAEPLLMVIPELDYCGLITGMEMKVLGMRSSFAFDAQKKYRYDFCAWNQKEDRIEFYYDEKPVGWIACTEYRMYRQEKEEPEGRLLTLVSVAFQHGGRTYDYLCELPGVAVGDRVIVPGYNGDTEVEVQAVYQKYESELGVPVERYKKVLRKA